MGAMQQSLLATAGAIADVLDTPQFIDAGPFSGSTGALTVSVPEAYINGDLIILVLSSANQTIADPTTGGTWTQVANSPQGTGTAAASQSTRCQVYYKVASGTQATAAVADSGSITMGQMFVFRKVNTTTPINVTSGSVLATAGTTHTLPSITTSSNNVMVAHCTGIGRDADANVNYSSPTNANLTDLTVITSRTLSGGAGGGIGLVTGVKATSGSTGTTSVTVAASAKGAFVSVGIAPSTNYNNTTRVIGSFGSVANSQPYSSGLDATSTITFNTDGTISIVGDNGLVEGLKWVNNPASGIGSSYWVRATSITGTGTGTMNTWLALSSSRSWTEVTPSGGGINNWFIKFEFASDSGGTTIVATTQTILYTSTESMPTVGTVGTVGGIIP